MNRKNLIIAVVVLIGIAAWIIIPQKKAVESTAEQKQVTEKKTDMTADKLYKEATALLEDRELLKVKDILNRILSDYPDYEFIEDVQKKLEQVNMQIIMSNVQSPNSVMHEIVPGDTLGKLAKKYGTTIDLIKIRNNLKNNIIRTGHKLSIWTGKFDILIDKSQNILMLKSNGEIMKTYTVATGENNSTPVGECKINSKLIDPVWFKEGSIVIPPDSPANALGSRWMGFDTMKGYGIHGTVDPETIGKQSTLGCIRMQNKDVEELFSIVPYGTSIKIID